MRKVARLRFTKLSSSHGTEWLLRSDLPARWVSHSCRSATVRGLQASAVNAAPTAGGRGHPEPFRYRHIPGVRFIGQS
jgi:hypothetical protein